MKNVLLIVAGLVLAGCAVAPPPTCRLDTPPLGDLKKGQQIYAQICAACHGPDPSQAGPLGPEISCSSRELIESVVLRAKYPAGYSRKRNTTMMPPFPQYKNNLDDLHRFLNSPDTWKTKPR